MKLAKMSTKQAANTLVRLALPVKRITSDDAFIEMLRSMAAVNRTRTLADMANVILDAVPLLLEGHYSDLVTIAAVITGKEAKKVEDEPLEDLIADLKECIDDEYVRFFTSSMQRAMKASDES